jgi:hypothetical protein
VSEREREIVFLENRGKFCAECMSGDLAATFQKITAAEQSEEFSI